MYAPSVCQCQCWDQRTHRSCGMYRLLIRSSLTDPNDPHRLVHIHPDPHSETHRILCRILQQNFLNQDSNGNADPTWANRVGKQAACSAWANIYMMFYSWKNSSMNHGPWAWPRWPKVGVSLSVTAPAHQPAAPSSWMALFILHWINHPRPPALIKSPYKLTGTGVFLVGGSGWGSWGEGSYFTCCWVKDRISPAAGWRIVFRLLLGEGSYFSCCWVKDRISPAAGWRIV